MTWDLEAREGAVVVRMRSNRVNCMNDGFFDDCAEAFRRLDAEHPGRPIVLTGEGATFSAGLDLDEAFPRFAGGDPAEIHAFFERFRTAMLRVLTAPRRVVGALNGHAFAGGVILALCCDARLIARGPARMALNEIPIGVPMPATYFEICRHALGTRVAGEAVLEGRVYDVDAAVAAGVVARAVEPARLIDDAVALAAVVTPDTAPAYAFSKRVLLAPLLASLDGECRALDGDAWRVVALPE